ncbi:MAG: universal stress protein [Thiohalocapsa sp.]
MPARIRTILVAASGGIATAGAIEQACHLARRFEAHLEALHVLPDQATLNAAAGEGIGSPAATALVSSLSEEASAKAAETRALFGKILGRHGIAQAGQAQAAVPDVSAVWRETTGNPAKAVAERGRFFDLVVLGRSDRVGHEPHTDTVEETLLRCGRPVLLAPPEPAADLGHSIAIAWNGSLQAVHALTAALPFLRRAGSVVLITAGDGDAAASSEAAAYLAWHGVTADRRTIAAVSGRGLGRALLAAAETAGADLLVMGAYGQPPWREQLFGGASRGALATMPLALLMMH